MNIIPISEASVNRTLRRVGATLLITGLAATAAACSSSSGASSDDGTLSVVASTNVWGDVVAQVAGDKAKVTSIISDPDQDPHSFEADPRVQLELSHAELVVKNGGGYDDFVGKLLKAAGKNPTVLDAVTVSGKTAPAGGDLNEHVWYDFPTVVKMADDIAADLGRADRKDAATFIANAKAFDAKVAELEQQEATIKAAHAGEGAAITEPVPLYMLQACGLVNRTPTAFSHAIEEGDDVSVGVLNSTLQLFRDHEVELLAYNEQTSGAETEKVLAAAKAAHISVVPVTETLPSGKSYLQWMTDNLAAIGSALDQH
jgi:zinc/manganese transport system substrate-binding protein